MPRTLNERGQASVEFAVVVAGFLVMVVALGCVWHAARDGRLLAVARESASHSMDDGMSLGLLQDVTAY